MKHKLKSIVKASPILYKLWFIKNKGNLDSNVRLPKKTDHYYFDGYPRSGNTYFHSLLKFLFPAISGASHLHCIAGLKLAIRYGIPKKIILIRKPEDAILSLTYGKCSADGLLDQNIIIDLIEENLFEYINYYKTILDMSIGSEDVLFIVFESVVNNRIKFINQVRDFLGNQECNDISLKNFDDKMKSLESSKPIGFSSLPNEERQKFKKHYSGYLKGESSFLKAQLLYKEVCNMQFL